MIGREAQRLRTRARVLDAAIVEFQRAGTSSADIKAIVDAAGVSRSTFYFHFPTKEHVLLELMRRDEAQLAEELSRFLDSSHDLPAVLEKIVELVLALEEQWGSKLFREVIGLYFSPNKPIHARPSCAPQPPASPTADSEVSAMMDAAQVRWL